MGDQGIFPPTSTGPGPTQQTPLGGDFGVQDITTPPVTPPGMPGMGMPPPEPEKKKLRILLFQKKKKKPSQQKR